MRRGERESVQTDEEFWTWFRERSEAAYCRVERVPLSDLKKWRFDERTGNLRHDSEGFFTVEGLEVRERGEPGGGWSQPIIHQTEVGILGLLVRERGGALQCLVQAKMEPGNYNVLQVSPTVQATRSNYTRVHKGNRTRYLEYFTGGAPAQVLTDALQSEQGSWFLGKRNRNVVVRTDDDVPATEGFCWLSLSVLQGLLSEDGVVNMDLRTVLSGLLSFLAQEDEPQDLIDTLTWFSEAKSRVDLVNTRVPLRGLTEWRYGSTEIGHERGLYFSVVGVSVRAGGREVAEWDQPLLRPRGRGVVAFAVRTVGGVDQVLVRAHVQAGLLDGVEMGPTVQCDPANHASAPPSFLDHVLDARPEQVLFDTLLAEEGGRFHQSVNRYMLVRVDEDFPADIPEGFRWTPVHHLSALLRHSYYVNIEARSLLACLHSL